MTKSAFMRFRLTAELKNAFDKVCQNKSKTPSDVLRELVAHYAQQPLENTSQTVPVETRWKVVNTRLTSSEYHSMTTAVTAENTTHSKWLLRCVREKSLQSPQLKDDEIKALSTALTRLQSVGRNLNQYVKCLHSQPTPVGIEGLNAYELTASIAETTQMVKALIRASTVRDYEHV